MVFRIVPLADLLNNFLVDFSLGKPLHWFVCMLHGIELYLKHYFTSIDGKTLGPSSYSGPIGKEINKDLSRLPIVLFNALPGKVNPLPKAVLQEMNNDQKYLHEACIQTNVRVYQGRSQLENCLINQPKGTIRNTIPIGSFDDVSQRFWRVINIRGGVILFYVKHERRIQKGLTNVFNKFMVQITTSVSTTWPLFLSFN